MDFTGQARKLIGKKVKVITVHDIFIGKLLAVGSDFLKLHLKMEGDQRVVIQIPLIIALFRVHDEIIEEHTHEEDEDDEFEKFLLDED